MTLDTYIPQYELKYYLNHDGITRYQIQFQVLNHYLLEHDILLTEKDPEVLIYDIMFWDIKWYEAKDKFEFCQALKDTMHNLERLLKNEATNL